VHPQKKKKKKREAGEKILKDARFAMGKKKLQSELK